MAVYALHAVHFHQIDATTSAFSQATDKVISRVEESQTGVQAWQWFQTQWQNQNLPQYLLH